MAISAKSEGKSWTTAMMFGYGVIFSFFGVFGVWAATAPLGSGIIATGEVAVSLGPQIIQHPEGGTITEILVREGEYVDKGEIMMRLDPLETNAQQRLIRNRLYALLSERARIVAERDFLDSLYLDNATEKFVGVTDFDQVLANEQKLFQTRRESFERETEIRREQIEQLRTEVSALQTREAAVRQQLDYIEEELAGIRLLFDKGQVTKPRLLSLQRAQAGYSGEIGTIQSQRARVGQQIHQQELTIEAVRQARINEAVGRLRAIDLDLTQIGEQLSLSDAKLERIEIKAPLSGRISDISVTTIGAVIGRGSVIMKIVPDAESFVIDAKVKPKDIDMVRLGATVEVRISAFNARTTPPIAGYVVAIAPDTTEGASTREKSYYKVKVELDPEILEKNLGDKFLLPGMPASAIIAVGERTLLEYWVTPLTSSFQQALREP
jgi:HlyD family type I secretion membrane fusion protein